MKKILVSLLLVFVASISLSQHLYIFNGFSIYSGEVVFENGAAIIELPYGTDIVPESLSVFGAPERTEIRYLPADSLKSLYEREIGEWIKFLFDDGRSEMLEVVSEFPVFRNSYGELLFNPKGSPVFTGEYIPTGQFLLKTQENYNGHAKFAYQTINNSWTARYSLSLEDFSMTGLMIVDLGVEPPSTITLVSSTPGFGYSARESSSKMANASYSISPTTSDAETRLYDISVPLARGINYVSFLSRVVQGEKRLVFRANWEMSSYTGVDIDVRIKEVPVDLPSGIIDIWSDSVYLGSAGIENVAEGESIALESIAKSIEITGKKISETVKTDSTYRYIRNTYYVRNLSEETSAVEIEDYLGQNVDQISVGNDEKFEYVKTEGKWSAVIMVGPDQIEEVEVDYRVRYGN
ncbi:MAG: hypothetical protein JW697_03090 [Kosmotogaceae bacterium]|nr:hypothetical protein [Kosmotogaceae bacterium]